MIFAFVVAAVLLAGCDKKTAAGGSTTAPAASATQPAVTDSAHVGLRYDGIYKYESNGVEYYLRFYPDATVVWRSNAGQTPRHNEFLGKVTVQGNRLSFTVVSSSTEAMDFTGEIIADQVHLDWYSHLRNGREHHAFAFVNLQPKQSDDLASRDDGDDAPKALHDGEVAYDLPDGGIIYGPPGGMRIVNPKLQPGDRIAVPGGYPLFIELKRHDESK